MLPLSYRVRRPFAPTAASPFPPASLGILCALAAAAAAAPPGAGVDPAALDLRACLRRATSANAEVLAARRRLKQAEAGVARARAEFRPRFEVGDNHRYTNQRFGNFFVNPSYSHDVTGTLSQRVYGGGARRAQLAGARGAKAGQKAAYRAVLESVLERVANAYLDVHEQVANQAALVEAIATQRRRLQDIRAKIDAGVMLETNRLQAEINLLEEERRLLVSKTSEKLARETIRVLLAYPAGGVPPLGPVVDPLADTDIETLSGLDLDASPAIQQGEAEMAVAEAQVDAARAAFKPTVDIGVTQIHIANGPGFVSQQDQNFANANGVITVPVFDGGRRKADLSQAKRRLEAAEMAVRSTRDELAIQVGQALLRIQEAQARRRSAEVRVQLAEKNRRIVQDRYLEGAAIQAEILDADVEWRRAKLEGISSHYAELRGGLQLLRITGQLGRVALLGVGALRR